MDVPTSLTGATREARLASTVSETSRRLGKCVLPTAILIGREILVSDRAARYLQGIACVRRGLRLRD